MTSVAESLVTWLLGYSGITSAERVDTDQVGDEAVSMGVLKAPGRTVTTFVDGSKEVTAYFLFRAKRAGQEDEMRVDNQEWLEGLETWVRERSRTRNLPSLSGGRECYAVAVSESAYLLEATDADVTYQIGLEVSYSEPKTLTA